MHSKACAYISQSEILWTAMSVFVPDKIKMFEINEKQNIFRNSMQMSFWSHSQNHHCKIVHKARQLCCRWMCRALQWPYSPGWICRIVCIIYWFRIITTSNAQQTMCIFHGTFCMIKHNFYIQMGSSTIALELQKKRYYGLICMVT